jgi:hypothetical protein
MSVEVDPWRVPRFTGQQLWRWLGIAGIALALWAARGEVSRLSGSILDTAGRAWPFESLFGLAALSAREGWTAQYPTAAPRAALLSVYAVVDATFMLVAFVLMLTLLKPWAHPDVVVASGRRSSSAGLLPASWRW